MSIQVASAPPPAPPAIAIGSRLRPPVVLAGAMGLACLPLLWLHAQTLWEKPHYQFFPWAVLGAVVLAWRRRELLRPLAPGLPPISYTFLALGGCLLLAAGYVVSPWLGMVAALIALIGYLWLLGGYRLFAALFPSLVLLFMLVPPPLGLDTRLILLLQTSTTNLASRTLDWLELPHVPLAHTLQVVGGPPLLVDEACSGIVSLFSVVTFTLFFCFYLRRKPAHLVALVFFAAVFVVLGNVARVVVITLLKAHDIDLVSGWKHEMTGLGVFAACLALTASMDQAILFFTEAVRFRSAGGSPPPSAGEPPALRKPTAALSLSGAGFLGAAFAGIGLLTLYNVWIHPHALRGDPSSHSLDAAAIQPKMNADALPEHVGHWERVSYERETRSSSDPIGHYSDTWRYRLGKSHASISVDYPFRGGHDLTVCYVAKGWHESAAVFPILKGDAVGAPTTVAVDFERSAIEKGYLWFSALDERGQWLSADALHRNTGMNRFVDRFATEASTTVQVQIFISTPTALDQAGRDEIQQLFQEVRATLRDRLFSAAQEQP